MALQYMGGGYLAKSAEIYPVQNTKATARIPSKVIVLSGRSYPFKFSSEAVAGSLLGCSIRSQVPLVVRPPTPSSELLFLLLMLASIISF